MSAFEVYWQCWVVTLERHCAQAKSLEVATLRLLTCDSALAYLAPGGNRARTGERSKGPTITVPY